jgi:hypothetical protein
MKGKKSMLILIFTLLSIVISSFPVVYAGIAATTSASSYDVGQTMTIQISQGTYDGEVMIQIDLGSTKVWADQRTLNSLGVLNYLLKIPSNWADGTYTVYVKDLTSGTQASTTFKIPIPSNGGGGGGGGGGVPGFILPSPLLVSIWSSTEAAGRLKDFRVPSVARILSQVEDSVHVAEIIELFDTEYALNVLTELGTAKSVTLMKLMKDESIVRLVLEFSESDKELLRGLLDDDFNRTVELVETAIKEKAAGLGDEERKQALERLAGAVSSLEVESIMELLIYMAELPETPTTVAYLFESMQLSIVIDVVEAWVTDARYAELILNLVNVLEKVSTQLLGDVYVGIGNVERETLYPYLTAGMVTGLPEIGEFLVTDLVASPSTVEPSEEVTISYTLSNVGGQTDRYVILLKVNGANVATDTGLLGNGTSIELSHKVIYAQAGIYSVSVEEASTSFTVEQPPPPPKPADLQVTNIELVPASVIQGEEVTVYATVTNLGELLGTGSFTMKLDTEDISSKEATLGGGDTVNIMFTIVADYTSGIHEIQVGSLSASLTVQIAPRQTPWFTIITGAIIVVGGLGLYFYNKRNQAFEGPVIHSNDVPENDE